ncbi:hypothetical protein PWR63_27355 [Paraburkholderia sp. A2WS-5]|uniref:hypothetical protein n=1 Tax=unclassified Paraburkholderia TaxID=2615204 RepID=UPI003B7737B0
MRHLLQYELMYDGGADDEPRLAGLLEAENLDNDERKSGSGERKSAPSQGQVTPRSGASQGSETTRKASPDKAEPETSAADGVKAVYREKKAAPERHRSHARIVEDTE